jgi:arginine utilization protein RocB
MYNKIYNMTISGKVEVLTRALVSTNSINGTNDEVEVLNFIKDTLLSFPYFQ